MKKVVADKLRSKNILNEWDLMKNGHPYVTIRGPSGSQDVTPHAVVLSVKGRRFKDAAWYENGARWFSYQGKEDREAATKKAFEWIEKAFPGMKMVASPFNRNSWVPEEDLNAIMEENK
jgi:hypothetical protein